jgi:hypothetical protein
MAFLLDKFKRHLVFKREEIVSNSSIKKSVKKHLVNKKKFKAHFYWSNLREN